MSCWWKKQPKKWIDVLIDIDGTIVHKKGPIRVPGFNASYRLATGAIEFLIALDKIPNVRLGFYSAGPACRNIPLIKKIIAKEIASRGHTVKEFGVFSVPGGMYGRKTLKKLRKDLDLTRTILVDDIGQFADTGEEKNLLKVYAARKFGDGNLSDAAAVYNARVNYNLVRALGMILQALDVSTCDKNKTLVEALHDLQWDGKIYLHESSNLQSVYQRGLEAMKNVNPEFCLAQKDSDVTPWTCVQDEELFHSDVFGDELFKNWVSDDLF